VGVKTGFLGTKSTLIPWRIVEVRDGEKRLVVAADKDAVKSVPAFDDEREITPSTRARSTPATVSKARRPPRIGDVTERTSGAQRENILARYAPA
jgi:hypothetical protein